MMDHIRLRTSTRQKTAVRVKKQAIEWEEVSAKYIAD